MIPLFIKFSLIFFHKLLLFSRDRLFFDYNITNFDLHIFIVQIFEANTPKNCDYIKERIDIER